MLLLAAVEMLMLDCNSAAVAEPMSKGSAGQRSLSVATELPLGGPVFTPTKPAGWHSTLAFLGGQVGTSRANAQSCLFRGSFYFKIIAVPRQESPG